jgi:hypothetical protein
MQQLEQYYKARQSTDTPEPVELTRSISNRTLDIVTQENEPPAPVSQLRNVIAQENEPPALVNQQRNVS